MLTLEELSAEVASGRVDTVILAMCDMQGRLQGKRLHARAFVDGIAEHGAEGCNYLLAVDVDMNTVPGYAMSSWEGGYGDFVFMPDLAHAAPHPVARGHGDGAVRPARGTTARPSWPRRARCCAGSSSASPSAAGAPTPARSSSSSSSTRPTTRRASKGWRELRPANAYNVDYSILGTTMVEPVLRAIRLGMAGAGMLVEDSKGECNFGQHEVNFRYQEALRMADDHAVYRNGAKEIAFLHGKALTFMPKYDEREGNSCHIHLSLWEGESSLFPAADGHGMSEHVPAVHRRPGAPHARADAAAGAQRQLLQALRARLVRARRRSSGGTTTAPARCAWSATGTGMRVESRVAGGDVNPYLAFAALLAAGLAGHRRRRTSSAPAWEGSGYDARDAAARALDAARGARAVRRLGARARGARRRGRRPLPERGDRRARRVRRRRHGLGAEALLRAPVSRPRIGISAYRTNARWTHWDLAATVIPQGYVEGVRLAGGVPILLPPTPEGAEEPGEVLDGIDGARADRRARPRPGALRRGARGGNGRADARAPDPRRLRARAAARGAPPRAARARHLPRPPAHERRARRHARAGHRPRRARSHAAPPAARHLRPASRHDRRRAPSPPTCSGEAVDDIHSHHHQGIAEMGEGLVVSGRAHDGSIEAIEDPAQPFCMAVLWHPEEAHDGTGAPLFRALVEAAAKRKGSAPG